MDQSKFGALGAALQRDMSEIADLPEFVAPPAGIYKLQIEAVEQKEINEKTCITVTYLILGNIALSDPADAEELAAIKDGSKMGETFWFDKADKLETTLSVLKAKYGGLGQALGTTNLLEIMTKMEGMTIQAQVKQRVDKEDKSKFYANTKNIVPFTG
jgi:hypothetical protein